MKESTPSFLPSPNPISDSSHPRTQFQIFSDATPFGKILCDQFGRFGITAGQDA